MIPPQVSSNIIFSQNSCTTSHDALFPFPHNLRRDRPFILVRQLTNLPANMIKASLMVLVDREMSTWRRGLMVPLKSSCTCDVCLLLQGVLHRSSHAWWCGQIFKYVYFWCYYTFFLLHLPVLIDHVALILHWYSNINPCWVFRVHSDGLYLSILLGRYYHSPGPNFHLSLFDLLKWRHSPLPDNIIGCFPQK